VDPFSNPIGLYHSLYFSTVIADLLSIHDSRKIGSGRMHLLRGGLLLIAQLLLVVKVSSIGVHRRPPQAVA
jgi:hypothetical protein